MGQKGHAWGVAWLDVTDVALTREERKAQTRQALIDAAAQLFARQGIEATSLEQIAGQVGLTKGAIYASFTSKEDLVRAVVETRSVGADQFEALLTEPMALAERLGGMAGVASEAIYQLPLETLLLDLEFLLYLLRDASPASSSFLDESDAGQRDDGRRLEEVVGKGGESLAMGGREVIVAVQALARGLAQELALHPGCISRPSVERLLALLAGAGAAATNEATVRPEEQGPEARG